MMKKRLKAAAAAAMALVMLGGALPAVPGGAELLNTPLTAHAAGSVTLDEETGTLYLDGAVTREDILAYREPVYKPYMDGYIPVYKVESVVANEGCILPEDCSELFQQERYETYEAPGDWYFEIQDWYNLSSIDLSKADTSHVTNMRSMFECCDLTSLDLSSFDTSNVKNMSRMFRSCYRLTSLDLSGFDTSNVTNMYAMFDGSDFYSVDLSSFDTSNVTDMSYMFKGCNSLTSLDLSSFDTSNVTDMSYMFEGCNSLTSLDLSNFDTSNVTDMESMFCYCKNLTSLDLSSFDTSNVTNMKYLFCGTYNMVIDNSNNLETIYVSDLWNTDSVNSSGAMFGKCPKLKGGNGTVYDKNHINKEYACIDGKDEKPGYLTYKEYKCPGSYVKGVSLALADQIGVTFYVNMKDQVKKAVLSGVPGEVTVTSLNQLLSGDYKGCVKLVYPVNATEARHTITLRLYDKDGKQLRLYNSDFRRAENDTISFSVQDYIEQAPQYYPDNEKAQKLAAALSNYCNAASNYFCGKDYTVEGIGDVTLASFAGFGVPLHGLKLSLVLNSKTELRVYGINDTDDYIGGTGSLPNLKYDAEGGYHKITGLKPAELVSADDYTINREYIVISPLTYGYYVMKNSDDEALKTVVRALFVYATTALEY